MASITGAVSRRQKPVACLAGRESNSQDLWMGVSRDELLTS